MPKFAANLSLLFTEVDFFDRFKAAADVGFKAVECIFPYTYSAAEIKQRLDDHELMLVKFNLPPGDLDAGDFGLTALPGRESEFRESVGKAIEYARLLACHQLHTPGWLGAGGPESDKVHGNLCGKLELRRRELVRARHRADDRGRQHP